MRQWALIGIATLLSACGSQEPPFDELSLRDALTAAPEAVTSLPVEAQRRLATRFEQARLRPEEPMRVAAPAPSLASLTPGAEPETPAVAALARVRTLDASRAAQTQDALVAALWRELTTEITVYSYTEAPRLAPTQPLPPLLGPAAGETAAQEAWALAGRAGALLERLRDAAGAQKLARVLAWPTAAAAVGDTVYVNAVWLSVMAALEPDADGAGAGGATGDRRGAGRLVGAYPISLAPQSDPGLDANANPDDKDGENRAQASGLGLCSSSCSSSASSCTDSCNSTTNTCNDSCKSSSDSCKSTSDNCNENTSCSSSNPEKDCCRACGVAPKVSPLVVSLPVLFWVLAPLLFLMLGDGRWRP